VLRESGGKKREGQGGKDNSKRDQEWVVAGIASAISNALGERGGRVERNRGRAKGT